MTSFRLRILAQTLPFLLIAPVALAQAPAKAPSRAQATAALNQPANPGAAQFLTADEIRSLHLDNPDAYMQRIYFWQDVPRRARYNEIWNEVKATQYQEAPAS